MALNFTEMATRIVLGDLVNPLNPALGRKGGLNLTEPFTSLSPRAKKNAEDAAIVSWTIICKEIVGHIISDGVISGTIAAGVPVTVAFPAGTGSTTSSASLTNGKIS